MIKGMVLNCPVLTGPNFQLARGQKLTSPAMNIHDAVTCTIFNNYYSPKESVIDAVKVLTERS